jgi:hypothetical protein
MPSLVVGKGVADIVLPLREIAGQLVRWSRD